jgi:hypothetical protein
MADSIWSNQSAHIFIIYHLNEMLIYRPFITKPSYFGPSSFPYPALSICTKAARAVVRIVKAQAPRGFWNVPLVVAAIGISVGILLVHMWHLKAKDKAGLAEAGEVPVSQVLESLFEDITILMGTLEVLEPRWEIAGQALYVTLSAVLSTDRLLTS